jgi:signal transduction histidine kinase
VDELIASEVPPSPTPNRETADGHDSGVNSLPEGPVPIGSLIFADELPDGVVVADEVGRIVVFNRAAARLTGLDPAEVTGKFVFDVLPLRDAEGNDWWLYADPYHGLPTRTRHPERSLHLACGTEVLVSVGYVRDRPPGLALRRLVLSLRSAQQRERLERSRAELVSTVAHELRSPLTSVKGFTATLLNKWGRFTDDQKRVMLETVNADADRVTRLITELLDVSRIESGRMEIHRQLVDLPDRARKTIAGRVAAGEPEDRFRLEVRGGLPETWLDADKIDQILGNLVENAVRHGAGIVTIVVEPAHLDTNAAMSGPTAVSGDAAMSGATAVSGAEAMRGATAVSGAEAANRSAAELGAPDAAAVSVRDQGEGIAPDVAPRVFRQFWRGKPQAGRRTGRHGGGTGLGLYIVKGLVEAHGGTIGVRSAPGGGAEFRFIVPAGAAAV